jgi:hypothetical protein
MKNNPKARQEDYVAALKKDLKRKHHYGDMASSTMGHLSTYVSKPIADRAIMIWARVIETIREHGHDVQVTDTSTMFIVLGQKIKVSIREKHKRIKVKEGRFPEYDLKPTGRLSFRFGERWKLKEIIDDKTLIEFKIPEMVPALEKFAKDENEFDERIRIVHEAQLERERIEKELRRLQENELSRFKKLLQEARRFQECELMRAYLNHLNRQSEVGDIVEQQRIVEMILWAEKRINWYDPSIVADEDVMSEVDANTLELKKKLGFY